LDEFINVWVIELPEPFENPEMELGAEAVQLNVVLATFDDNAIPVVPPEQIIWDEGVAEATGIGFT
jgi:hypothetical protein